MTKDFSFEVLSDGSLVLKLDESCIQTAAKRAHREVTAVLLDGRAAATTHGSLADTLARFLSTADFAALRAEHPELAGGTRCRVRLSRTENGGVRWAVVGPR